MGHAPFNTTRIRERKRVQYVQISNTPSCYLADSVMDSRHAGIGRSAAMYVKCLISASQLLVMINIDIGSREIGPLVPLAASGMSSAYTLLHLLRSNTKAL